MFDFWYEYKYVVPKGFTRFLGKLSELTDMGVEVHYFTGNHDIWAYDYLAKECGVILHKQPETTEIYGHEFYLAHGDGMGDPNKSFKLIRAIFHNRVCQWLFSGLHPRWGMSFGLSWARHSYIKHKESDEPQYMGALLAHVVLITDAPHLREGIAYGQNGGMNAFQFGGTVDGLKESLLQGILFEHLVVFESEWDASQTAYVATHTGTDVK